MGISDLFKDFRNSSTNYEDYTTEKEFFKNIESVNNATALHLKADTFVPQLDYSKPENFIQFGSAELFYESALTRIIDYYPYDGSEFEKTGRMQPAFIEIEGDNLDDWLEAATWHSGRENIPRRIGDEFSMLCDGDASTWH